MCKDANKLKKAEEKRALGKVVGQSKPQLCVGLLLVPVFMQSRAFSKQELKEVLHREFKIQSDKNHTLGTKSETQKSDTYWQRVIFIYHSRSNKAFVLQIKNKTRRPSITLTKLFRKTLIWCFFIFFLIFFILWWVLNWFHFRAQTGRGGWVGLKWWHQAATIQ